MRHLLLFFFNPELDAVDGISGRKIKLKRLNFTAWHTRAFSTRIEQQKQFNFMTGNTRLLYESKNRDLHFSTASQLFSASAVSLTRSLSSNAKLK